MMWLVALLVATVCGALASPKPLSKISISSQRAVCKPSPELNGAFQFTYEKKVKVLLADKTKIQAQKLDILLSNDLLNGSLSQTDSSNKQAVSEYVKKITLSGNVLYKRKDRSVKAQRIVIDPESNTCHLDGDVVIRQSKGKKPEAGSSLPLITKSEHATINMTTNHISLEGSDEKPISTTLRLGKQPKNDTPNTHVSIQNYTLNVTTT